MQLCYQHWEWWWRSFFVGASGAIFVAIYTLIFMFTHMQVKNAVNDACFILYIMIFIVCYGLAAGAVAVNASYYFVANIYSNIRKD